MPPSRYVSAERLMRMLVYLALSVAALIGVDVAMGAMGSSLAVRRTVTVIWIVALPLGGWLVWRSGRH
jgi:uncharacterized protein (DUF2062 family)